MFKSDTSPEVERYYDQKIGELSEEKRFLRGLSLTHFCRELCLAGILEREPDLKGGALKARFFEVVYGDEFSAAERQRIITFLTMSSTP